MTQLCPTLPDTNLAKVLLPQFEADLRAVAEIFDASFWPPEPLDEDLVELLEMTAVSARESGASVDGFISVCRRFGLELEFSGR